MIIDENDGHPITGSKFSMTAPVWPPTGGKIVGSGGDGDSNGLHIVDLKSGAHEQVTFTPDLSEAGCNWSADEKFLAFTARSANSDDAGQHSVYVLDLTSGKSPKITTGRHNVSWST
ncbi:MAG: Tol biopolymer transport system component [Candidatus Krumholzibacteriia bacterium]|jgi:Tol biopolymer transport system component